MVTEFLYIALFLAVLVYLKLTSNFDYWKKRGVKYIKPIPFFGNSFKMALFRKAPPEMFQGFYHAEEFQGEKFGGLFLGSRPILLVKDLDLIKKIMIKDFQYFSDRGNVSGTKFNCTWLPLNESSPLSAHLFNLSGWRWRALRIKLTPTFTSGKMKMMYGVMKECAQRLDEMLKEPARQEKVLEMKEPLAQFATDVIGTCAFGLQLNAMENPDCEFRAMGRRLFNASVWNGFKRMLLVTVPAIARYFGISFVDKDLSDFFLKAVSDTVKYREENNVSRNDFMQLLIELKNKGAVHDPEGTVVEIAKVGGDDEKQVLELTDDLLAAQAFIFFIAGFETSSTTMSFALYELALNPDIQERLANEIRTTIEENNGELTYEVLHSMKYLDMVIAETLRKYPPLGNLFRKATKPYNIEGTKLIIEPEYRVFIPVYAIQRDPKYYPDPDRFDPERFTPEEKEKRHPMTYLPFGDGPRNCIGARFGLLQTKLGLSTLINKYAFEVCAETPIPPQLEPKSFVTLLKGGVILRIKERQPMHT